MPDRFPLGRFLWYELLTTDPDAAISFYKKVVGWGLLPWDQDPSYRMFTAGDTPVGAVMNLPDEAKQMGAPPHWMFYVAVADTDATVRQVKSLGGRAYMESMDIPSVGRLAVLADPQGATFAILQPSGDPGGHDAPRKPGEFSWHELATTDPVAAWRFYRALFGWDDADAMDMGPMGTYQMFGRSGVPLGGIYRKPAEMPAPPHWLCYAMVANADRAASEAARLGGRVLNGPMDVPGGGRIAQCMDPQGAAFAVHSMAAAKPPQPAKPKTKAKPKPKVKLKPKAPATRRPVKKSAKKRVAARSRPVKKAARKGRPVKKRATARKKRR